MEAGFETTPGTRRVVALQSNIRSPYMQDPAKTPHLATTPRNDEDTSQIYAACIENGTREVGIAMLSLHPPSLSLYQFSDTSLYSYANNILEVTSPSKILVVQSPVKSAFTQILSEKYDDTKIVNIPRSQFSDSKGIELLNQLSNCPNEIFGSTTPTKNRYLCLSSANAVINYALNNENIQIYPSSLRTVFHPLEGHLMIDPMCLTNFNIITAPKSSLLRFSTSKKNLATPSLFNFLDRTITTNGERFLRSNLAAPPSDPRHINLRLDFVRELADNDELKNEIKNSLKGIDDLDPVITYLVANHAKKCQPSFSLDVILKLLTVSKNMSKIHDCLSQMSNVLAKSLTGAIEQSNFDKIIEALSDFDDTFDNDKKQYKGDNSKYIYIVKNGRNSVLDVTRKTYDKTIEEIYNLPQEIFDKYSIKCQIKFNKSRRYHIQIKKSDMDKNQLKLPSEFIFVTSSDSYISCTTQELLILNKSNESSEFDTISVSQKFAESKMNNIREFISSIYSISEAIGFIDFLYSLAVVTSEMKNANRPIIDEKMTSIKMVDGRNPVMEKIFQNKLSENMSKILTSDMKNEFIPLSIYLTPVKKISILSGVNASGKTTLLQTICLNLIMANTGCFVPCKELSVPIISSLFIKSSQVNDYIESGTSSFKREMMELSNISMHSDQRSLVLIDEPCSSTSALDGCSLAWTLIEKLIINKSFAIISTHYRELEEMSNIYKEVNSNQMISEVNSDGKFSFTYKVGEGNLSEMMYGIRAAQGFLPSDVISYAKEVYENISVPKEKKKKMSGKNAAAALIQRIINLNTTNLDNDGLRACLTSIRKRCSIK
ncbi:MutS domain III family protein [Trichomonas vaginalis G3]|uniref:MutS domain III family protein n=2 Tax=Trichomonas vaginalis TaxID=5722 RepID=A2FMY0_TRIV3|nr:DNA MISMATCH repair protein MUTS family member family [Trichomonas vaginalis G3]EAX93748.1 MutS domain III family protein [Trichomonas vaginalis G3]KAI5533763.1 DNA MISMATCH repair protein MUTS family member family [Trichomonas vaginalis G3]|eukprot:XP_001306678.1 MutS domain III family protein [Trichomonas vaginalis G3]